MLYFCGGEAISDEGIVVVIVVVWEECPWNLGSSASREEGTRSPTLVFWFLRLDSCR